MPMLSPSFSSWSLSFSSMMSPLDYVEGGIHSTSLSFVSMQDLKKKVINWVRPIIPNLGGGGESPMPLSAI